MEIYQGRRLSVEKKRYDLPNGKTKETVVVHPGDAVVILPIAGEHLFLIRQWRPVINSYILEAPAGKVEPGEAPESTALRELIEETRMAADTLTPLGTIYTTPGFSDEKLWLYAASNLHSSDVHPPDEDEIIELLRFTPGEVHTMIQDGRIEDAKTIAIFARYWGMYGSQ